jgi:hypothetical protein
LIEQDREVKEPEPVQEEEIAIPIILILRGESLKNELFLEIETEETQKVLLIFAEDLAGVNRFMLLIFYCPVPYYFR